MQCVAKSHLIFGVTIGLITVSFLAACGDSSQQKPEATTQATGEPQSESKSPVLTAQISRSPLFESPQGWSEGFTKATGQGPGVVVGPGIDNPNVFAQQFSTKANEPYKIVARMASVGKPKAKGRLQANWLDQNGKFLATSVKVVEATPEEKTFENYVVAPAGAAVGMLYVTPDGPDDVVRYTEMRLLGKDEGTKTN